jgi:hypothetical protein
MQIILIRCYLFLLFISLLPAVASAQVIVKGRVFDMSATRPLEAVTVLANTGKGTMTDANGNYSIAVNENDSIWFSYLNKRTPKYPVKSIVNLNSFEISLHVNYTELKEVRITPPNYRRDSMQNRMDYAKAFDFRKPGLGTSLSVSPVGVGLDLDEFINMFRFRKNRRMLAFQQRLLQEEADKYIDHRFSRALVKRITGLSGAELDTFMLRYRPSLELTESTTDYEFQSYIKDSFLHYRKLQRMMNDLKGPE